MRGKAVIPLVLGLAIGVVTVKLLIDTIRKARAAGGTVKTVTLVQAARDIGAFDEIMPDMVKTLETADSALTPAPERIEDLKLVIGRVAGKPIPQGAPVLQSMLAPEGTPPGMTGRIPSGYRAVSVRIDEVTGVAFQLRAGDWVDVIVVMDVDSPATGRRDTIAEVVLQHVQVAAVGYSSEVRGAPGKPDVKPAKSATLLVLEADVPKLHLAATHGRVTLAMRGADDLATDKGSGARLAELSGGKPASDGADGKKVPSWLDALGTMMANADKKSPSRPADSTGEPQRPAAQPHTVTVVHGGAGGDSSASVERITFENKDSTRIIEVGSGASMGRGSLNRVNQPQQTNRPSAGDQNETTPSASDSRDDS